MGKLDFMVIRDDLPSVNFTGLISRGFCIIGYDVQLQPREHRSVGIVICQWFIGWVAKREA